MERRTVKVGITGKYGTRYGAKLRKQVKQIEIIQRTKYQCPFCGKVIKYLKQSLVRRTATGIWRCRACRRQIAGGAWELATSTATTAKTTINRLKKEMFDVKKLNEEEAAKRDEKKEKGDNKKTDKKKTDKKKK